jgi:hypothetical protein
MVSHMSLFFPILRQFIPAMMPPAPKPAKKNTTNIVLHPHGDLSIDVERGITEATPNPIGIAVNNSPNPTLYLYSVELPPLLSLFTTVVQDASSQVATSVQLNTSHRVSFFIFRLSSSADFDSSLVN